MTSEEVRERLARCTELAGSDPGQAWEEARRLVFDVWQLEVRERLERCTEMSKTDPVQAWEEARRLIFDLWHLVERTRRDVDRLVQQGRARDKADLKRSRREDELTREVEALRAHNAVLTAHVATLERQAAEVEKNPEVDLGGFQWDLLERKWEKALGHPRMYLRWDLLVTGFLALGPRFVNWAAGLTEEGWERVLHIGFSVEKFYQALCGEGGPVTMTFKNPPRGRKFLFSPAAQDLLGGIPDLTRQEDAEKCARLLTAGELVSTDNRIRLAGEPDVKGASGNGCPSHNSGDGSPARRAADQVGSRDNREALGTRTTEFGHEP